MTRAVAIFLLVFVTADCSPHHVRTGRRVIVLGVDGLDYQLVRRLIAQGRMPNFARLSQSGAFQPLASSIPPQSPVAWSTFITGLDPGQNGIFDFIHRDPKTMTPFLSTSRTERGETINFGRWQIPLRGGHVELLRHGDPFWAALERRGVETTVVRMPRDPRVHGHRELVVIHGRAVVKEHAVGIERDRAFPRPALGRREAEKLWVIAGFHPSNLRLAGGSGNVLDRRVYFGA